MTDPSDEPAWHLGKTPEELTFAEFQHALICLGESFYRYVGRSLSQIVGDPNLSGYEAVILNVIHTAGRPKSIADIQHFTNRTDVANVQYSVRKLIKARLIEPAPRQRGRGMAYRLTRQGALAVERYAAARQTLLRRFPEGEEKVMDRMKDATVLMTVLAGLYDQASRSLLTEP